MTRVLILYAKSGFLGHQVIADNYNRLLKQSGYDVQCYDVLDFDRTYHTEFGKKMYLWGIKCAPGLWRILYSHWQKIPFASWFRTAVLPRYFRNTQKYIVKTNPNLIITTHPIATSIVNYLKTTKVITAKVFTTFSDWHIQPFWLFPCVNKYLVAIDHQRNELIEIGVCPEQIAVTGILLNEVFYNSISRKDARQQLGIPNDKKVILVMGGGMSWCVENIIVSLSQLSSKPHIIIVGASNKRKRQIEAYIAQLEFSSRNFDVTGFVETNVYLSAADLLISKPGGLTTSEAFLLKIPLLATTLLPGQEEANMKVLESNNAVLKIDTNTNPVEYIDYLLTNHYYLEHIVSAAFNLAPKFSPQIIVELVQKELNEC